MHPTLMLCRHSVCHSCRAVSENWTFGQPWWENTGDGHILDEETVVSTILGLTAERNQARERSELAEEAVREVAKREREGKDDLEMEVRRIRMAMEQSYERRRALRRHGFA